MTIRFNPPPGWPRPPAGWQPEPGWLPDADWPAPPPQWQFWVGEDNNEPLPDQLLSPKLRREPEAKSRTTSKAALWGWGGLALMVATGFSEGGVRSALSSGAAYITIVAVVALFRGHVDWARLTSRRAGAVTAVVAMAVVMIGGDSTPDSEQVTAGLPVSVTTTPAPSEPVEATTPDDPVELQLADAEDGTALQVLAALPVVTDPATGYRATAFGEVYRDTDGNGCGQRDDVLRRDLTQKRLRARTNGCAVVTGTLKDPYSGSIAKVTAKTSKAVSVDHVVSLRSAWATGATEWDDDRRNKFANDLVALQATPTAQFEAKDGDDAQAWLPPRTAYRCTYVARQIGIKHDYELGVTSGERRAMATVLARCSDRSVVKPKAVQLGGSPIYQEPKPKPRSLVTQQPVKPKPKPKPKPATEPPRRQGVHPGAFCSPQGGLGYTSKGTLMKCSSKGGDQARWRKV